MVAARGAKTSSSTRESDAATDSSRCASPTAGCLKLYDIMTRDAVEQGRLLPRTDHVLRYLARIDHGTIASQAKAYAFLNFTIGRLLVLGQRKDLLLEGLICSILQLGFNVQKLMTTTFSSIAFRLPATLLEFEGCHSG